MTKQTKAIDILMEARDCIFCVSSGIYFDSRSRRRIFWEDRNMSASKSKPKTRKATAKPVDPIFAAIAEHKAISQELWGRLYYALNEAEDEACKTHGRRTSYIWRRNCDVHFELASAERAGNEWDQRTGIAPLRAQYERGKLAEDRAKRHLARTNPTTPAGAGALVAYILRDLEDVELEGWHSAALKTAAASLARMNREAA
jgi:hypothetical protein